MQELIKRIFDFIGLFFTANCTQLQPNIIRVLMALGLQNREGVQQAVKVASKGRDNINRQEGKLILYQNL